MSWPRVQITVTPYRLTGSDVVLGEPVSGQHLIAHSYGVWIDHKPVLRRDRRVLRSRTPGESWLGPDYNEVASWTGYKLEVEA